MRDNSVFVYLQRFCSREYLIQLLIWRCRSTRDDVVPARAVFWLTHQPIVNIGSVRISGRPCPSRTITRQSCHSSARESMDLWTSHTPIVCIINENMCLQLYTNCHTLTHLIDSHHKAGIDWKDPYANDYSNHRNFQLRVRYLQLNGHNGHFELGRMRGYFLCGHDLNMNPAREQ